MVKEKKTTIKINDKDWVVEEMDQLQTHWYNHLCDLERKIGSLSFNLDQHHLGKMKCLELLADALENPKTEVEEAEVVN